MAKNDRARLDCRALPYLDPAPRVEHVGDIGAVLMASQSRAPARAAVEARSELSFVDQLVDALEADLPGDGPAAAATVLCTPTVAARKPLANGESLILQSVILERLADDLETQVSVELRALPGKPGTLAIETVAVNYLDLDTAGDRCAAVAKVEAWWRDFPMPALKIPEPFPLRAWAWLGNPEHVGILNVPPGWRQQVERLGAVYGVQPLVVETVGQIDAWTVADRIEHGVLLRGSKLTDRFQAVATASNIEIFEHGVGGEDFAAVLNVVRARLLEEAEAAAAPAPSSRSLMAGEIVYHRKVGDSKKVDRFDAGSTTPCSHGAASFKSWGGDKARKGMARRYDNFTNEMLIHCIKFPNCGVYGVSAERGGIKPTGEPSASNG